MLKLNTIGASSSLAFAAIEAARHSILACSTIEVDDVGGRFHCNNLPAQNYIMGCCRPTSFHALVVVLVCTGARTYKPREKLIYDIAPKDAGRFPMIEKHSRIHKEHYGGDKRVVRTTKGYKYGSAYPIYHVRNSLQITWHWSWRYRESSWIFYVTAMDLEKAKENHRAKKSPQIIATLTGRFSFFMKSYKQISILFKFSNELWSNSLLWSTASLGGFSLGTATTWTSPAFLSIDETQCLPDNCDITGVSEEEASWIAAIFGLCAAIGGPAAGFLIGKYGRKWMLMWNAVPMALGFAAFLLAGIIDDHVLIYVGRSLTGEKVFTHTCI